MWTILCIFLSLLYSSLILLYVWGWHRLPTQKFSPKIPTTSICVIIPVRNEATHIGDCLQSVLEQQYPAHLLEVIVIDDHSTDQTPEIVENFKQQYPNLQLLKLAELLPESSVLNAYKKKAIELAIAHTQQELIVTTDGDCKMNGLWLHHIARLYEKEQPKLIAAPVCFTGEQTFFQRFQTLDFMGMIIATGASVGMGLSNMCNGANLAYQRQAFYEVEGFKGIDDIASGDDMLLMNKIADRYPNSIRFLKSRAATVFSYPQPTFYSFVQQRLRWASKTAKYKDKRITILLAGVYFFNITMVINLIAACCGLISLGKLFLIQFLLKALVDLLFLGSGAYFFKRNKLLWLFLPSQFLHILYIIGIGTLGNFGSYTWKGRKVK